MRLDRKYRRLLAAAMFAIALALSFVAVSAKTDVIFASVDIPAANEQVPYNGFYLSGWALDCKTGTVPEALFVGAQNQYLPDRWQPQTIYTQYGVSRPDVAQVFAYTCPGVTSTSTGYYLHFSPPLPPGNWIVYVVWANAAGTSYTETKYVQVQSY